MQRITIEQLQVPALIGVYDWERTQQTQLLITIELDVDVVPAMLSDNVADTIDYGKVAEFVKSVANSTNFELLEALGHYLCQQVLVSFPIQKIKLIIEKPDILPDAKTVSVMMAFTREGVCSI